MTDNVNKHITDYLDYYTSLNIPPGYAVLLRGNWGAGKSWFIKNYIESYSKDYLYVSLYGISSFKEIEDSFFVQLHPVLGSKTAKFAGQFLKAMLKATIKVDMPGKVDNEIEIDGKIPAIDITGMLKNIENKKIIFDDLERCSIELQTLLGYINQLVENNGLKVILLGNESEMIKAQMTPKGKENKYLSIKEKLIGKSFDIKIDIMAAFESFISEVDDDRVKTKIRENEKLIIEIFYHAGYGNLRHLRHTILEFARFFNYLPKKTFNPSGLFQHILQLFFAISFELRKGTLSESDLSKIFLIDHLMRAKNDTDIKPWQYVSDKYTVFNNYHHPLDIEQFICFFIYGSANRQIIVKSIEKSIYFIDENTADWTKLYYFQDLEDEQFQLLLNKVHLQLEQKSIVSIEILMHIVGNLCQLIDLKLFAATKKDIISLASDNLKMIIDCNKGKKLYFNIGHSAGLSYQALNTIEVRDFQNLCINALSEKDLHDLEQKATALLELMVTDTQLFIQQITITNISPSLYYNIPIFLNISIKDFIKKLLQVPNKQKYLIGQAFIKRYTERQFKPALSRELAWLKSIDTTLNKKIKSIPSGPTKYALEQFSDLHLKQSITGLKG